MRKLLLLLFFYLIFVSALGNSSKVQSASTDPCQACVGGACVRLADPPYCNNNFNQCSPTASCSNDCGCFPTPTPTPTSTPRPTATATPPPYNCTCGGNGNCIPLDGTRATTGCHDVWYSGCETGGCGKYYSRWRSYCDNTAPLGGTYGYSCRYDTQCLVGNVCSSESTCRIIQGSNFCGDSGCSNCQRQTNIRQCYCDGVNASSGWCICSYICNADSSCGTCATPTGTGTPTGPPPPGSCTVDLLPSTTSVSPGSSIGLTAAVTIGSGTVDNVTFSSSNPGVATVNPAVDSTVVYSTQVAGVTTGTVTVTSNVVMGGSVACTDTSTVDVVPAGPWWQVKDADVTSGGDIISQIPGTCTLPVCNPVFELAGDGGFPGIPLYAGAAADFQAGSGTGTVADPPYAWLVNANYSSPKSYDFTYFQRQIPADVIFTEITTPAYNGGDFNSGGAPSRGYVWYHYDGATLGDLTITGNVNLTGSRRVVLLVEAADLYITGLVNLQSPGNGFFMAVVGKDANGLKGNIIVDPSVSHPIQPAMEGIFLAEGEFRTGAGTNQFYFRGSVVGYDGIVLERDLGSANEDTPGEYFEYSPAIMATFPQVFTTRRLRWKEVAP